MQSTQLYKRNNRAGALQEPCQPASRGAAHILWDNGTVYINGIYNGTVYTVAIYTVAIYNAAIYQRDIMLQYRMK